MRDKICFLHPFDARKCKVIFAICSRGRLLVGTRSSATSISTPSHVMFMSIYRPDSRLAPSQWETSLQSNAVSHWLGANLESALCPCSASCVNQGLVNVWSPCVVNRPRLSSKDGAHSLQTTGHSLFKLRQIINGRHFCKLYLNGGVWGVSL